MSTEQSWQRPEETRIACCAARFNTTRFDSCLETHKANNNKNRRRRRRRQRRRQRRRAETAEGEEKKGAYVSSVMGAMLWPANRQTWVWPMSWWCDSTGCTYRLGSQLWLMNLATLPSCFASRMYFACLWVPLTSKCSIHSFSYCYYHYECYHHDHHHHRLYCCSLELGIQNVLRLLVGLPDRQVQYSSEQLI